MYKIIGSPTKVKVDLNIRSMGPISEADMVIFFSFFFSNFTLIWLIEKGEIIFQIFLTLTLTFPNVLHWPPDILHGFILPTNLERWTVDIQCHLQWACGLKQNSESDVETWHLLLQWTWLLLAHNHCAKQASPNSTRWRDPLLNEVHGWWSRYSMTWMQLNPIPFFHATLSVIQYPKYLL